MDSLASSSKRGAGGCDRAGSRGFGSARGSWRSRGSRGGWWRGTSQRGESHIQKETVNGPAPKRPQFIQRTLSSDSRGYPCWSKYFPSQAYSSESAVSKQVKAFETYFKRHLTDVTLDEVGANGLLPVDATSLLQDSGLLTALPDLPDQIQDHPESTLNSMGLALHMVLINQEQRHNATSMDGEREGGGSGEGGDGGGAKDNSQVYDDLPRLNIRLYNFGPIVPLKSIKAPLYGKCVSVQGTVVRVSNIKPLVTAMAFRCTYCQGVQAVALLDGKYTQPNRCSTMECRGRTFVPLRSCSLTETVDWQTIKIQELSGGDRREAGRIPRTIECELTSDLVDSCVPGDMVTITGIVKATNTEEGSRGRNSKDKCMFLLYLQAISVTNSKGAGADPSSGLFMDFTTKDYYAIAEIQSDKDVFKLIVGSLCPTIYGHEMVKAGLVLGLFGGSHRYADLQNTIPIRGDPHVLVVGDPGLGKSQMLQAASNIAPRGVYVCGNTTTTSGLTVTLVREAGSGEFALEAGALVLADQGCCCIDEFDKMTNQHQALLEAMEQQCISIAKAGVVCSLPARTSILAAANPTGGHYSKAKTVSENLKMSSALLSRFDLVFILLDRPDDEMDSLLSEHVMSLHAQGRGGGGGGGRGGRGGGKKRARLSTSGDNGGFLRATARRNSQGGIDTSMNQSSASLLLLGEDTNPLQERLKWRQEEDFDPIPCQLLRKYVGYSKKYVHPKLGEEAAGVLQKFYLELRKHRHTTDSTPITTRQLESLIRLTEARARLELREEATEQDASDVVEIMKFSMNDTFSDQYGILDFDRSQHGSGMSQRAQGKRLVSELSRVADHNGSSMFTVQQMKDIAKRIGVQMGKFEDLVYSLNNQNYLLKKGAKLYQLQTAS